ncbi:MAG: hypothetical protein AAF215_16370 [Cyanobacteria bacterium P01_A01_bin.123]
MSPHLRQVLQDIDRLTPAEQWAVMGHIVNQLQQQMMGSTETSQDKQILMEDEWDRQIAQDVTNGRLDHLIAKAEADIKAGKVRDLDEVWIGSHNEYEELLK